MHANLQLLWFPRSKLTAINGPDPLTKPTKARERVLTRTSRDLADPLNALEMREQAHWIHPSRNFAWGGFRPDDTEMQF